MEDYRKVPVYELEEEEKSLAESSSTEVESFLEKQEPCRAQVKSRHRVFAEQYGLHAIALTANFIFFLLLWNNGSRCDMSQQRLSPSPAQDAIHWVSQQWDWTNIHFRNGSVNPARQFKGFGPPSEESDKAWENLIQYQNIRLQKDELGEFKDVTDLVEFSDAAGGYYATLSVYHSLHCVKRVHHHLYFDEYYPTATEQHKTLMLQHTEHCLNILLQMAKCQADITVLPMEWAATTRIPIGLDEGHHQCIQWETLDQWMKERSVDVFEPGVVIHPTLGEAYPNRTGDEVGIALDHLLGGNRHEVPGSS